MNEVDPSRGAAFPPALRTTSDNDARSRASEPDAVGAEEPAKRESSGTRLVPAPAKVDVSVVIPTFNRRRRVARAIASCAEAAPGLAVQVVVVDDGSTDGTSSVLERAAPEILLARFPENRGRAAARNEGLRLAVGEFVKFLDSDDVLAEGSLRGEVEAARRGQVDMVVSGWSRAPEDEMGELDLGAAVVFESPDLMPLPDRLLEGRAAPVSAVLYRRSFLAGLEWDPVVTHPDDWLFFCSAALRGPRVTRLDRPAFVWVDHSDERASQVQPIEYARNHHRILRFIRGELARRGELSEIRREALARYFYRQLPVLAREDPQAFEAGVQEILELSPRFRPGPAERRALIRILARVAGFRQALLWRAALARAISRWRR